LPVRRHPPARRCMVSPARGMQERSRQLSSAALIWQDVEEPCPDAVSSDDSFETAQDEPSYMVSVMLGIGGSANGRGSERASSQHSAPRYRARSHSHGEDFSDADGASAGSSGSVLSDPASDNASMCSSTVRRHEEVTSDFERRVSIGWDQVLAASRDGNTCESDGSTATATNTHDGKRSESEGLANRAPSASASAPSASTRQPSSFGLGWAHCTGVGPGLPSPVVRAGRPGSEPSCLRAHCLEALPVDHEEVRPARALAHPLLWQGLPPSPWIPATKKTAKALSEGMLRSSTRRILVSL